LQGSPIQACIIRLDKPIGPAQARNLGAARAVAQLLWFSDDDVLTHPTTPRAYAVNARIYEGAVLGGGVKIVCTAPPPRLCSRCNVDYPLTIEVDRVCSACDICGCNLVVPADVFARCGGFPETGRISTGGPAPIGSARGRATNSLLGTPRPVPHPRRRKQDTPAA
jgi:GT2 family glycosyltransferase